MQSANDERLKLLEEWRADPLIFIEDMWGLVPQPLKPLYHDRIIQLEDYKPDMFMPFDKGRHITWQQWIVFESVKLALQKKAPLKIAIESGVGTGKTAAIAILILWFLMCHKNAQVPCTAPTSDQLHDALWKEIRVWLDKMPKEASEMYEWTNGYVKFKLLPDTWFARARTGRKENPEALSGIHGDHVMLVVEEGSGVPDEIYLKAEGVMAGDNVLVIIISQHTRLVGFFHECFHSARHQWQKFRFNAEESPIVNRQLVDNILEKYGSDSDEYRVQVLGQEPNSESVDKSGYVPLIQRERVAFGHSMPFVGRRRLGVDCAGSGSNKTVWVVRDDFRAEIVATEAQSTEVSIAGKTLTILKQYEIMGSDTWIDNFGVGANVSAYLARAGEMVNGVNAGDHCKDPEDDKRFLNMRMAIAWRTRQWLYRGGLLVSNKGWDELVSLRYAAQLGGKMKLMSKEDMVKAGYESPDHYDALALTFWEDSVEIPQRRRSYSTEAFDPYAVI